MKRPHLNKKIHPVLQFIKDTFNRESFSDLNKKQQRQVKAFSIKHGYGKGRTRFVIDEKGAKRIHPFRAPAHRKTPGYVRYIVTIDADNKRQFRKVVA